MANTSLPSLDENGLLPFGIHHVELSAFEQRFVHDFHSSYTRREIFNGYLRLMKVILPLGLTGWQWLDGSYVTNKEDPKDLDIVTFLQGEELDALSAEDQTTILELLYGKESTHFLFHCDTWLIVIHPENDREFQVNKNLEAEKRRTFGRTNPVKTGMEIPKGFVRVDLSSSQPPASQSAAIDSSIMVETPTKSEPTPQLAREPDIEWSAADLEESLAVCVSARQRLEEIGNTRFSSRLQVASLKKEEAWLRQRIAAAHLLESEFDAEIVIDGSPVVNHRVDATFYSKLIQLLQELVVGLTFGNAPTQLQLAPSVASSYKTPFVIVDEATNLPSTNQLSFEQDLGVPKLAPLSGADVLIDILDDSATKTSITQALESKYTKIRYAKMVKLIGDKNATVYLRTKHNPLGAKITPDIAQERANWLQEMTWKVEAVTVEGELREAGLDTGRFRIDSGTEIYTGRTKKEMAEVFRGFRMGAKVRVTLEKTTKNHIELDQPLISFSLQSIDEATNPAEEDFSTDEPVLSL